jgi:hypothetical protein
MNPLNFLNRALRRFLTDKRAAMKFDIMGIVLMIIAIAVGQFLGTWLAPMLGSEFSSGIIGSLLVGALCYVIYTFLSGGKFGLTGLVIFAVLIYVANLIAAYVATMLGIGGGFATLGIAGVVASLLWGWVGGKQAKRGGKGTALKSPIKI